VLNEEDGIALLYPMVCDGGQWAIAGRSISAPTVGFPRRGKSQFGGASHFSTDAGTFLSSILYMECQAFGAHLISERRRRRRLPRLLLAIHDGHDGVTSVFLQRCTNETSETRDTRF
jgi:hypothetical protein